MGRRVDAVAQASKQGYLFVFDRVTGKSLFPIEERPVPASDVPGEHAAPTQPVPLKPAPFARQELTAALLTNRTPQAHAQALAEFAKLRSGGLFQPLTTGRQTVVFPGFDGGAEWGGPAVDRKRGVLYINSNDIAWTGGLTAAPPVGTVDLGASIYVEQCSSCHGVDRQGAPPDFPNIQDIGSRLLDWEISRLIAGGKGRMPGYPQLAGSAMQALVDHLRGGGSSLREPTLATNAAARPRYTFTGYRKLLDAEGYPAVAPPWGTLNAIDLNSGEYLWKVPLGRYPALAQTGASDTGTENYGGPLVTAGALVFIGATVYDRKFRAFDSHTGKILWEADLPYAGVATPITYQIGNKQYIVIATSGQRDTKGPQGSAYIAFALRP
jgi:quinoprotein glucose dehydrogenase